MSTYISQQPDLLNIPAINTRSPGFFLLSSVLSVLMATGLLWAMHQLIRIHGGDVPVHDEGYELKMVDLVREKPKPPEPVQTIKPPPLIEPPSAPKPPSWATPSITGSGVVIPSFDQKPDFVIEHGTVTFADNSDYMVLTKIQPVYPQRAIARNIEGYCVVNYTISKTGSVKDVTIEQANCTHALFYKSSVTAAEKFKYSPRMVDGEPVEVYGVRNRFRYELN